jgi:hypothetical protein
MAGAARNRGVKEGDEGEAGQQQDKIKRAP